MQRHVLAFDAFIGRHIVFLEVSVFGFFLLLLLSLDGHVWPSMLLPTQSLMKLLN